MKDSMSASPDVSRLRHANQKQWRGPSVALALGGGGARGFGHIPVLEALDELGVTPTAIAGTSMGAIVGAAYAAGFSGRELRRHALKAFHDPIAVASGLIKSRTGRLRHLLGNLANPVLVDAEKLLGRFWPAGMPADFADLRLPFTAVASEHIGRDEVLMSSGPLASAVAGSMAIPGLVRPVARAGRLLIDGVAVNPVPVDAVAHLAEVVIAVEVNAGPRAMAERDALTLPNAIDAMLDGFAIMEYRLMRERFARNPPTIHLQPAVGAFRVLDFMKVSAILKASDAAGEQAKLELRRLTRRRH
jgi:NTE family protein